MHNVFFSVLRSHLGCFVKFSHLVSWGFSSLTVSQTPCFWWLCPHLERGNYSQHPSGEAFAYMTWNSSTWEVGVFSLHLFIYSFNYLTSCIMIIYFTSWTITQYDYVYLFAEIIPFPWRGSFNLGCMIVHTSVIVCVYIVHTCIYIDVFLFVSNDPLLSGMTRYSMLILCISCFENSTRILHIFVEECY